MFCGFGAVVLLVMLLNGDMLAGRKEVVADLQGEAMRLEREVKAGEEYLVAIKNSLRSIEEDIKETAGRSERVLSSLEQRKIELADTLARSRATKQHVNQLQSDLQKLDSETSILLAEEKANRQSGRRVRQFIGQGDRQYLTGLRLGGKRVLILVDGSASMLDETIVNVLIKRNLDEKIRRSAEKWQRAMQTVEWLVANLPPQSSLQMYVFNSEARAVLAKETGWVPVTDSETVDRMLQGLSMHIPAKGTSLYNAFAAIKALTPRPDNILLLTDGLPTMGKRKSGKSTVSGEERRNYFSDALDQLPLSLPVNTILFPMEGDPFAAVSFWKLALDTNGSFLTPARDWP